MWLQISAGQGPAECAWVVAHLLEYMQQSAQGEGLKLLLLKADPGPEPHTLNSALCSLEGPQAENWARSWQGSILWVGQSPFRPTHKRKNWFVGVQCYEPVTATELNPRDLHFESQRSSGPGGQNVNKVESAVRLTHLPSGLSVLAQEERSQMRNRQLALARLSALLQSQDQARQQAADQSRWLAHHALERGNPIKSFKGRNFELIKR